MRRRHNNRQQKRRNDFGEQESEQSQPQHEINTLIKDFADFVVMLLPITTGNQNLGPDAETKTHHENSQIVDAGNGSCSQFHFSHPAEKSCIRHSYHLFHHQADQNRISNTHDIFPGIDFFC